MRRLFRLLRHIFFFSFFCQADFHAVETAFPDLPSPQGDIEQHHQREPEGRAPSGADIAVLIGPGLGDKFFDDNIDHCTGGESRGYRAARVLRERLRGWSVLRRQARQRRRGFRGKGFAFRGSACGEGG